MLPTPMVSARRRAHCSDTSETSTAVTAAPAPAQLNAPRLGKLKVKIREQDLDLGKIHVGTTEPFDVAPVIRIVPVTMASQYGDQVGVENRDLQEFLRAVAECAGPFLPHLPVFGHREGVRFIRAFGDCYAHPPVRREIVPLLKAPHAMPSRLKERQ